MSAWLSIVVATAVGLVLVLAVLLLVVRPLSRRLPWRVEERRHPGGILIELRRPGHAPRAVAVVPRGAEEQRREALRQAEELRHRLNRGE